MKRFTFSLLALVGLSALVVATAATAPAVEIVINGGAESGPSTDSDSAVVAPSGWTTTGNFSAVKYGYSGFPSQEKSTAIHGGVSMFAGGPDNASSSATQTVKIPSAWLKKVKAGRVRAKASAALGGWDGQPDAATVSYVFLGSNGASVGTVKLGPVTPAQRANVSELIPVTKTLKVPKAARSVKITIMAIRGSGAYNDGYADNVSLVLTR
jgi:hypothetical protein